MIEKIIEILFSPIGGIQRRNEFERIYFKIGLIINKGNIAHTADYLGYSIKSIHNHMVKHKDLKKLRDELVGNIDYSEFGGIDMEKISKQSPYFSINDFRGRTVKIEDLCNQRIEETKKKYWFKDEPVEEQIKIIKRIKDLYEYGEPDL